MSRGYDDQSSWLFFLLLSLVGSFVYVGLVERGKEHETHRRGYDKKKMEWDRITSFPSPSQPTKEEKEEDSLSYLMVSIIVVLGRTDRTPPWRLYIFFSQEIICAAALILTHKNTFFLNSRRRIERNR